MSAHRSWIASKLGPTVIITFAIAALTARLATSAPTTAANPDEQFKSHVEAGKLAAAQNRMAKAAKEYDEAWKLKPEELEIGMEASLAYAAIEEYFTSSKIAREVVLSADGELLERAKRHLDRIKPLVEAAIQTKTKEVESLLDVDKGKEAEPLVRDLLALEAKPTYTLFLMTRALAQQGNAAAAVETAAKAIAAGFIEKDKWRTTPEVVMLASDKQFEELMQDTFGKPFATSILEQAAILREQRTWIANHKPLSNSVGIHLVPIPPGTFTMGSVESEVSRDKREIQRQIKISRGFLMATTELTQAQWNAIMDKNPSHFKGDDLPVDSVTWDEAVEYCKKLGTKENKQYRLPTEAEWEYACRAGTTGAFGGNGRMEEMGWSADNSGDVKIDAYRMWQTDRFNYPDRIHANKGRTHPTGQKKPNAWGLFDMHGNVWEWCSDWCANYPPEDAVDPLGPSDGATRVLRGGSYDFHLWSCRSAFRSWADPSARLDRFGFRVCLQID